MFNEAGGNLRFGKGAPKGDEKKPDHSDGGKGDGFHHHEMHENESGIHSKHTHPDGREEHGDHASYEDAKADQDRQFGHGGDDQGDAGDSSESGSSSNMSQMYSGDCE